MKLTVAEWAKRLQVTPSAVYKQLARTGGRAGVSTGGPHNRGKMMVTENRIRLAFPGRIEQRSGANRMLTEFIEKLDLMLETQEAHEAALKVLLKRTEHLAKFVDTSNPGSGS